MSYGIPPEDLAVAAELEIIANKINHNEELKQEIYLLIKEIRSGVWSCDEILTD